MDLLKVCEGNKRLLEGLLLDASTHAPIKYASTDYPDHAPDDPMLVNDVAGLIRDGKMIRKYGSEVSTYERNLMNNREDESFFGADDLFNTVNDDHTWTPTDYVELGEALCEKYINMPKIEVSCGEALFLTSLHDEKGKAIPFLSRIGFLDRKLRVVLENTDDGYDSEALIDAYRSVYAFEFQGDRLLIARLNILQTLFDYFDYRYAMAPPIMLVYVILDAVSRNIWQMDSLNYMAPFSGVMSEITNWKEGKTYLVKDLFERGLT